MDTAASTLVSRERRSLVVAKDGHGLGTEWSPWLGIAIVLTVGAVIGLFNGFMIVKLGFNGFIFTLGLLISLALLGSLAGAAALAAVVRRVTRPDRTPVRAS